MNMTTYKSRYCLINESKYTGDPTNIICRSSWEKAACKYFDVSPNILEWSSEEVIVPYRCRTDGRVHRYFIDYKIKLKTQQVYLIEVKPYKETQPPKKQKKTKQYMYQLKTYAKNRSKWEAAKKFADDKGWVFQVWTEKTFKKIGIKIQNSR